MFKLGFCIYGPQCRFKHVKIAGAPPPAFVSSPSLSCLHDLPSRWGPGQPACCAGREAVADVPRHTTLRHMPSHFPHVVPAPAPHHSARCATHAPRPPSQGGGGGGV